MRDLPPARKHGQDNSPEISRYLTTSRSKIPACLRVDQVTVVEHMEQKHLPGSFIRISGQK